MTKTKNAKMSQQMKAMGTIQTRRRRRRSVGRNWDLPLGADILTAEAQKGKVWLQAGVDSSVEASSIIWLPWNLIVP